MLLVAGGRAQRSMNVVPANCNLKHAHLCGKGVQLSQRALDLSRQGSQRRLDGAGHIVAKKAIEVADVRTLVFPPDCLQGRW